MTYSGPVLTDEQALILTAYTGICCVAPFSRFHEYAETVLARPVMTHEFADQMVWRVLKERSEADFLRVCGAPQP